MRAFLILAASILASAGVSSAQERRGPPTGWSSQIDGLSSWQGEASLSGGGDVAVNRGFVRGGVFHSWDGGTTAGLQLSVGRFDYRFRNTQSQPWGDITDLRISAPVRFRAGDRATVFVSPSLRYDYESGAGASSGRTYGVFAGIAWEVNPRLTLGPAFGAFTRLEDNDLEVFPALLVDWEISDRWSLSTGSGLGATQGPGLSLSYAVTEAWNVSLSARSENVRFRLNNSGPAPGGVGEDSSIPVVLTVSYDPNPGLSFTAFAGAELNGELTLDDATGRQISRQTYDTAPVAGFAFRLRF
ncbi:MAG: hypothetical protein AB3N23_11790 [Paracoccaceae bacterium]